MIEIIPAILGSNLQEVINQITQVEGLVNWVQLDVVDGLFAPVWSWGEPGRLTDLPGRIKLEAHLMIEKPEYFVDDWFPVADRVLIHYEATEKLDDILRQFKNSPVKFGLVINLATRLSLLDPYLERLDHLQLMGISQVGFQGQAFEPEVIERVRTVRRKSPNVTIAVDGGVNLENAAALVEAGATHLVIGSAIWESGEVPGTIKKFQDVVR